MTMLHLNVRAASKQAAYEAAKAQIVQQCAAGADPSVWVGLLVNVLIPVPDDASRDVAIAGFLQHETDGHVTVALTAGTMEK